MSEEQKQMSDSILYSERRFPSPPRRNPVPTTNGVEPKEVADALLSGGKGKKNKAYRRSDSNSAMGARSRGHTKELALLPDDSLMVPPSFMTGLKPEQSLKDGSRLELKVQVKGDPDPMVTWMKDNKSIASNEIMEVKYKNGVASVIINEVFPEDAGRYTCKATNSKGSVETSSKVSIIPMEKKANGTNGSLSSGPLAPRVIKHVTSSAVNDGEPVTLTCTLGGADQLDVIWLHNEKEIKPSKDFEYKSSGQTHSLIIHEIFPEDAGSYTCEAFNDVGECFSTCSLVVDVPGEEVLSPVFKSFPTSLTVNKGSSASFEATLTAPPATVTWMKDGKEVKEQPMKHRISSSGNKVCLDVMECSVSDAGQYALIVTNKKGESKAAFSLNI